MTAAANSALLTIAGNRLRRRWRGLVAVGLIAGLVGGAAIASFAGAHRTSTAYDRLLAASDFPDALVQLTEPRSGLADDIVGAAAVDRSVEAVFLVGRHRDQRNQVLLPVQAAASPVADFVVVSGRAADQDRADEAVVSEGFAEIIGLGVGDVFPYQALSSDEFADLLRDRWRGTASGPSVDLRIVGIVRSPTDAVFGEFPTLFGTAAFHARYAPEDPGSAGVWVHLHEGADMSTFEAEVGGGSGPASSDRIDGAEVIDFGTLRQGLDDGVAALVLGMVLFGGVVMVAAIIVVAQLVSRTAERDDPDRRVLGDLGLTSRDRLRADVVPGMVPVVVAACTSVVVAGALSRFAPVGVAAQVEPGPGTDWNVAALGLGGAVVAVGTAVVWSAVHHRPERRTAVRSRVGRTGLVAALSRWGTGPTPSVAASFAFGGTARSNPRWLGFIGVSAGVTGVVACTLFGASLDRLASEPARWGWVADHAVEVPAPVREQSYAALDDATDVDAYAELQGGEVMVENRLVGVYRFTARRGTMGPTLLDGQEPVGPGEIALGPALLADLDVGIGDTVEMDGGLRRVVGSVLTPDLGDRSSYATAAVVGSPLEDVIYTTALVRFADGVDQMRAAEELYGDLEYGPPIRPSPVSNLAALRTLPLLLGTVFFLVGIAATVHVALWMAGRARGDLAVVRAMGLPRRRAIRTVTRAVGMIVVFAGTVGVALGALAGRTIWTAVAASTDLATDLRVVPLLVLVVPIVVGVASVLGWWSGRGAVRSPLTTVLRTE